MLWLLRVSTEPSPLGSVSRLGDGCGLSSAGNRGHTYLVSGFGPGLVGSGGGFPHRGVAAGEESGAVRCRGL